MISQIRVSENDRSLKISLKIFSFFRFSSVFPQDLCIIECRSRSNRTFQVSVVCSEARAYVYNRCIVCSFHATVTNKRRRFGRHAD